VATNRVFGSSTSLNHMVDIYLVDIVSEYNVLIEIDFPQVRRSLGARIIDESVQCMWVCSFESHF